ncbi:19519_t:CDS:2, partial [Gigaspora rosea]
YDSALILEDDVDIELNITSIMTHIHIFYLRIEIFYILVIVWAGKDTAGDLKLIKLLAKLFIPLDLHLISKIEEGVLKSYSVNPAAIIQTNDNQSDLSPDNYAHWS